MIFDPAIFDPAIFDVVTSTGGKLSRGPRVMVLEPDEDETAILAVLSLSESW